MTYFLKCLFIFFGFQKIKLLLLSTSSQWHTKLPVHHTYETSYNFPQLSDYCLPLQLLSLCFFSSQTELTASFVPPIIQAYSSPRSWQRDPHTQGPLFSLIQCLCEFFDFYYFELIFSLWFNLYLDDDKDIILVFVFHFCFIVLVSEILLLYQL